MPSAAVARSILTPARVWRLAAQSLLAILALAAVTLASAHLQPADPEVTAAALTYLIIVVLLSLNGSFISAASVSLVAVIFLEDLAAPPLFSLSLDEPLDLVAPPVFLTTALIITRLVARMRASLLKLRLSLDDLQRAEAGARRQAALLDLTHDTVFVRDQDDVITFWNRGAQQLYGWEVDEAVGSVTHELLRTEFPTPLVEITAELSRTGRWEGELIQTRRDHSKVVVASRWALQRDAAARPVATLETNNDITARRQAEEQLLRAQTELAHITRVTTLGELAASIAHEVNQPLTAIGADANAALNWLEPEKPNVAQARASLLAILKDSQRAADVLARIRSMLSRSSHPFEPCNLCVIVQETLPLTRAEFARHAIGLKTLLPGGLPLVMGDRIQLQQVLLNLLVNAADASKGVTPERRHVTIYAAAQSVGQQTTVLLEVCDSGVGIPEAEFARLFEAFYSTKPSGLGMGLSISRAIVARHGGRLWATANADYGATFHFSLPALP